MDDSNLAELLRSDSEEALTYIIEAYSKLLWVIVGGILSHAGTIEDIEECISDTFVSLWQKPKAFDPGKGSLKTFLAVIARRRALDKLRHLTKNKTIGLDDAIPATGDDLFEQTAKRDQSKELFEAVCRLGEPDKEILIRRFFFDEKPSAIAEKTKIPVKEVKNRLYQSKQRLRKTLGDWEGADSE